MNDEEIKRRLTDLEDGWTERKLQTVGGDDVRKALVAFANSLPDGEEALLFIGVADDGTAIGVDNPDNMQKNVRRWADWCYPAIRHTSRVIESGGKHVVAVIVQPDHNRPHFAGPAYVRVGSESIKANEILFDELIASRMNKARPLLEAMRKGELVSVVVWHFGNRSILNCKVIDCTAHLAVFQPESGSPFSGDYEQILLGRAADGKQLRVEIRHLGPS
ncbi:MAG TPA: ATP-binding protein [Pyrinomonadaceae bacterium]